MKFRLKNIIGLILCVVVCCAVFVGCNKKDDNADEQPLKAETIHIKTADDLINAQQYVGVKYKNYTLTLENHIDLTDKEWVPIGRTLSKAFYGTFDGQNHTIKGLTIKDINSEGQPNYIAKQIIGWLDDGTPAYKSTEIVKVTRGKEIAQNSGRYEVKSIVREGDDEDPNYQNCTEETNASFGSVGLFGYTFGATIKNLTIDGADLSFFASGNYTYAGIVSGYDVGSTFERINVSNSKIGISAILESKIKYDDENGTPVQKEYINNSNQYVGGLIGYAKSNTFTDENGKKQLKQTVLNGVGISKFSFSNANTIANYNDKGIDITDGKLHIAMEGTDEEKGKYDVKTAENPVTYTYPVQLFAGGAIGSGYGVKINEVNVNDFNNVSEDTLLTARSVYAGGIAGKIEESQSTNSNANNSVVSGAKFTTNITLGYVQNKAIIGGAYGLVRSSNVKGTEVNGFDTQVAGENLTNVCIAGCIAYVDEKSEISNINVKNVDIYSDYSEDGEAAELGSVIGGAVAVLRDSKLTGAAVETAKIQIPGKDKEPYIFTRGIVAQVYGNATMKESTAKDVKVSVGGVDQVWTEVEPRQYKNNYVNEDGYTSTRLYYSPNGETYGNTYVTVYGNLVARDYNKNLMIEDEVYQKVNIPKDDIIDYVHDGQTYKVVVGNKYYVYMPIDPKDDEGNVIKTTWKWVPIRETGEEKGDTSYTTSKYSNSKIYAVKKSMYRVEMVGAFLDEVQYYEYSEDTKELTLTKDKKPVAGKVYYINKDEGLIEDYYFDIKVYSESGELIVVDPKDIDNEDDDVLAKARFRVDKNIVEGVELSSSTGAISYAEALFDVYFAPNAGFKIDINGFQIKNVQNREFALYILVSGRPNVDMSTIEYIY